MGIKERINKLDKSLLLMAAIVLIALVATLLTGGWQLTLDGLKQSGQLINTIWLRLFLGFTPFGLTLTTALPTLGSIVIALALVALHRKYKAEE